jgi:hypothetical protein
MKPITVLKFVLVLTAMYAAMVLFSGCGVDYQDDLRSQHCSSSCVTLQGRFTTAGGTVPIDNAEIKIRWIKSGGELGGGIIRDKARTTTNANGAYGITFTPREDETEGYYELLYGLDKNTYLIENEDHSFYIHEFTVDSVYHLNYQIPLRAQVIIEINNPEAINTDDYFFITMQTPMGQEGESFFGTGGDWSYIQTTPGRKWTVGGDQPVTISLSRKKDGVESSEELTVEVPAGTTKIVKVSF